MKHELLGKIIICNILFKKNDFSKIYSQSQTRRLETQIPNICNNIRDISENMFSTPNFKGCFHPLNTEDCRSRNIWVTIFFQNKILSFSTKRKVTSLKIISKPVIKSWRVLFVRWFWRSLRYEFSWQRSIITYYGEIIGGWNSLQL